MPHRSPRLRPALTGLAALTVALSTVLGASTAPASAAPAAPAGLQTLGEREAGLPLFSWRAASRAVSYEVQADDDNGFGSPLFSVTTANVAYAHTKVVPDGTQYWRVRSVAADRSTSAWSQVEFQVPRTAAPAPIAPANDTVLDQPEDPPLLEWSPVPGATRYVVQLDDESAFAGAEEYETEATSIVVTDPLAVGNPYYWRVRAVRETGIESAFSATRNFEVGALAFPEVLPVVVLPSEDPSDGVTDVVLDWRPVPGARYYDLEVSTDDDFAPSTIIDTKTKITGTRYSPKVTYDNNQYYWRVRAVGSNSTTQLPNVSAWSSSLNQFRRSYTTPPAPLYPLTTTTEVSDPLHFQWSPVAHATQYELQVGTDPTFSPGSFESCQTAATTYTPGAGRYNLVSGTLAPEGCYPGPGATSYWRVRPLDLPYQQQGNTVPGVTGIFSAVQSFVYLPDAFASLPDDIEPFRPTDGESVDVPTLRWQPDQQAEKYRVVIRDRDGDQVVAATTYADSFTPRLALDPTKNPFTWTVSGVEADGQPASLAYTSSFNVTGSTPAIPGEPLTATEGDGFSSLRTPHFAWVPHPDAETYTVRVVRAGTNISADVGTDLMNKTLAYNEVTESSKILLTPGSYEWIVYANTPSGTEMGPRHEMIIDQLPAVEGQLLALDGGTLAEGDGCAGSVLSPVDTCPDLPSTPVLRWDSVPGAAFYVVYMSQDDRFTNLLEATTSMSATSNTFFTPQMEARAATYPDSQAGASYFWHVRPCKTTTQCAIDPVSAGTSLATNTFRKKSPEITGGTAVAGTGDGSEVVFTWQDYRITNAATTWTPTGEKPHQSAALYQLQVATSDSFGTILEDVEVDQPTYTSFTKLYRDGPVVWRVRAIDADDNQLSWSPVYTYAKAGPAVQLQAPINNDEISGSVPLQWAPQAYAEAYEVQVASDNDVNFSAENILFSEETPQTAYTWNEVIPASPQPYVWRVRRIDSVGNLGAWSAPRRFTNPGAAPTLVRPAANATVPATRALFTWTLAPGAATYRVEIRQGPRLDTHTTAANAYAPTSALTSGSKTWRVVALDAGRNVVGASATRTFIVDATAPTVLKVTPKGTVARTAKFTITFNERVTGVSRTTVKIVKRGSKKAVPAVVTIASNGRVATIKPRARLARLTSYELLVTSGIRDRQGNALRGESFRFRTKG